MSKSKFIKKSKLTLSEELEFPDDVFNDQPLFDPEPLDSSFDRYCDKLLIDPISSSSDEDEGDNDSSSEYDVKKDLRNINEDEDVMMRMSVFFLLVKYYKRINTAKI